MLVAVTFMLGGCAAPTVIASAGANALQQGTSAFINGELDAAQIASLETVYKAGLDALGDLQFPITSSRLNKSSAGITSKEINGRAIRIELNAKSPIVTKINIRVGILGDQAISRLLLAEIQARCPAIPEPAPQPEPPVAPPAEPPPPPASPGPPLALVASGTS